VSAYVVGRNGGEEKGGSMPKKTEADRLWRVIWEIDVPGSTPEEAAFNALKIMRDKETMALSFEVRIPRGRNVSLDLEEYAFCDDCGHVFRVEDDNDFANIPDLNERIEPGGVVPVCECPKCGCLAYPIK